MSVPGSCSSTFCRFMHTILWTRSPPRTTHAVRARRTSGSPGGTGIRGAESGGNPPLNQCLPGTRRTPSCPAHVRAVDAPVCSVAAHTAGPIAKVLHPLVSWLELGGVVAAAVLASNMSAIYALQAMGEDDADSHAYPEAPAEVVIDRMAAAHVARFRRRHAFFAYGFASWAEARDAGGQPIADAWSELRMDFDRERFGEGSQAIVAEPPMVQILEARVVEVHGLGDARWMCLLASWLIMAGCLRHQHLERSHPVSLTASTFHFYCEKGKQGSQSPPRLAMGGGGRMPGRTTLSGCLSLSNCCAAWPLTLRAVVGRFARSTLWPRSWG